MPSRPGSIANATPITSPAAFDERAARVAGRERRGEHEHVAAARRRCGRCRCRPRRSPRRRARATARSGPPPGWPYTAPTSSDVARRRAASRRASRPGDAQHREVADRVERDDASRRSSLTVGVFDGRRRPPPRRRARSSRRGRASRPSRSPPGSGRTRGRSTFTIDARTVRVDVGRDRRPRAASPGSGGSSSGPSAEGYGASEIARPHAANCAGWVGRELVDDADDRRAARHARRPALGASRATGSSSRRARARRRVPIAAPAIAVPARQRRAVGAE